MVTVVILTLNEEKHLGRAINSVQGFATSVYVIDSGSTDNTLQIAAELGANILVHPFKNQSDQFNWALGQLPEGSDWIMRLDADEIVDSTLSDNIACRIKSLPSEIGGVVVGRRIKFLGRPIRYGGIFPVKMVRIFRLKKARSEERWMDEHIVAEGKLVEFQGEILDDNKNSLSWWIAKHNQYASREAVEVLNGGLKFLVRNADARLDSQSKFRRFLKNEIYLRAPPGMRPLVYFVYRYIFRLGFLDGFEGLIFHVLQGFWYRFLVDAKVYEVRAYMRQNKVDAICAIEHVLGIKVLAN